MLLTAYLLLLHDPQPHPLLCIEEPEKQLHPKLLHELSEEFRNYSENGGQVLFPPVFAYSLRALYGPLVRLANRIINKGWGVPQPLFLF